MNLPSWEEPGQGMNSAPARVRPFWEVELGHSSFSKFKNGRSCIYCILPFFLDFRSGSVKALFIAPFFLSAFVLFMPSKVPLLLSLSLLS